jgi:hypothetical protein
MAPEREPQQTEPGQSEVSTPAPSDSELSDEQLDQVAGGRAVIFESELTQSEVINH